jgi:hypothetical protein
MNKIPSAKASFVVPAKVVNFDNTTSPSYLNVSFSSRR